MASRPQRDPEATKARILTAAQRLFSERGYGATGVRDIACEAQANSALVSRYFGSKEGLFEAALEDLLDAGMMTGIPRHEFGERLMDFFASRNPAPHPLRLMILSASDDRARVIVDRLLRDRLLVPLKQWLDAEDAEARAAHLLLLSAGLFFYRLIFPLEALTGAMNPALRAWLAREFQSIVDR